MIPKRVFWSAAAILIAAACGGCPEQKWKSAPGQTIQFEIVDKSVDANEMAEAVRTRLHPMRVVISVPAARLIAVWFPYSEAHKKAAGEYHAAMDALRQSTSQEKAPVRQVAELLDTVEEKESQEALEAIQKAHPASAPLIVTAASAAKALHVAANGEVEPEVIESVLTMRGELDFHIAVMPEEIGGTGSSEQKAVIASLRDKGPSAPLTANGTQARWIPVEWHRQSDFKTGYVVESLDGDLYMLCYDDSARDNPGPKSLKHNDPARKPWHVSSRPPFYDPQSGVTLPFYLDPAGATYMGELSELNVNHPIALVLDGTVVSAPTIRAKFTDAGVITFGTDGGKRTRAQVEADAILLSRRLKAADMPSPLRRIP